MGSWQGRVRLGTEGSGQYACSFEENLPKVKKYINELV